MSSIISQGFPIHEGEIVIKQHTNKYYKLQTVINAIQEKSWCPYGVMGGPNLDPVVKKEFSEKGIFKLGYKGWIRVHKVKIWEESPHLEETVRVKSLHWEST